MKRMIQRCGGLCVLAFAVVSMLGADSGCNPLASDLVSTPADDCCPTGSEHYRCSLQVTITNVQIMNDPGPAGDVRCFAPPPACAPSAADAAASVQTLAQLYYSGSGSKIVSAQAVQCVPVGGCIDNGTGPSPQDFPGACTVIEPSGTGGSGAGGGTAASCGMQNDGCTEDSDCCSGVCSLNACQLVDMQHTPPDEHLGAGGAGGEAP